LDIPEKNYKFTESDITERKYWKDYMRAYQKCIQKTSEAAPWYVIPADDKKNMRIIVSEVILKEMRRLDIAYPQIGDEKKLKFEEFRKRLQNESEDSSDSEEDKKKK
jgi:hypothetical protein